MNASRESEVVGAGSAGTISAVWSWRSSLLRKSTSACCCQRYQQERCDHGGNGCRPYVARPTHLDPLPLGAIDRRDSAPFMSHGTAS